jgi:hypothetical protein
MEFDLEALSEWPFLENHEQRETINIVRGLYARMWLRGGGQCREGCRQHTADKR